MIVTDDSSTTLEQKETIVDADEKKVPDISTIVDSETVQDDAKVNMEDDDAQTYTQPEDMCGPGTMLVGDECVLAQGDKPDASDTSISNKEVIYGVVGGFVIAGAVGIVMALMYRASRRKP